MHESLEDDISETSSLTDNQEIVLSLLYVLSGTLSVLGSSTIVYKVLKNRKKTTPYDRLMLGLSGFDILASLTFALSPFLLPAKTSPRVWASGTDATCSVLGLFTQLAFAALVYNGLLSFYYLLTVRFGVKRKQFSDRYEFWMHFCTIIFFVFTAIVGAAIGLYSEIQVSLGCWINDFPKGCSENGGCISQHIAWVFGAGPTLLTFLSILVNNLVIFFHVRRNLGERSGQGLTAEEAISARQSERAARQRSQIREVATQGFLYVGTFVMAYTPAIVLRGVEGYSDGTVDEGPIYPLLVLNSLLLPLQGFFNMFVYNRLYYARVRAANPEMSILQAVRKTCLDSDIIGTTSKPPSNSGKTNSNKMLKDKSGSGAAFSLGLNVVREGSNEDDLASNFEESFTEEHADRVLEGGGAHDKEEKTRSSPLGVDNVSSTGSAQDLVMRTSLTGFDGVDRSDLVLEEESKEICMEAGRSHRRVIMDGSVQECSIETSKE